MPSATEPRGAKFELDPGKAPRRRIVTDVTDVVTAPLHTISLLVRNKPGVLVRVSLVFSRRGYNMESLVVSPAMSVAGFDAAPGEFSRMTITCSGDPDTLEQIINRLAGQVVVEPLRQLFMAAKQPELLGQRAQE